MVTSFTESVQSIQLSIPNGRPDSIPTHKERTQRNPVCRPYRAKVATSNIGGSLAKLARNAISDEEECELDKVRFSENRQQRSSVGRLGNSLCFLKEYTLRYG
jgi:hypothetical protein